MKIVTLTEQNYERVVADAAAIIRRGGMIVYPTETAYALGVDATNKGAVRKLYTFKKRADDKPTHVLVSGMEMASEYAEVNEFGKTLMQRFWPGPLTIEYSKIKLICNSPSCTQKQIAMRQSSHRFAQELVEKSEVPITTPSANYHDDKTPYTLKDIIDNFGDANPHIDLVIDGGELSGGVSTLVSVVDNTLTIIREGVITAEDIHDVLH